MKERQYDQANSPSRLISQLSDDEIAELKCRVREGTLRLRDGNPELAMIALDIETIRRALGL